MARVPSPEPPVTAPAPRGCVSAHGQSGSSAAASPVRASPAGLSRSPAYAGARARRHRLRGTCWVPRCPPVPPPRLDHRAHLARLPPPDPRARREAVRRAGDAAIPAEGAAWGQRAPRARPSPPPESRGACARRGRGARACVCLRLPADTRPAGSSQGSFLLRARAGPKASNRGPLSASPPLPPFLQVPHS